MTRSPPAQALGIKRTDPDGTTQMVGSYHPLRYDEESKRDLLHDWEVAYPRATFQWVRVMEMPDDADE
jgi:hypothetical protein